MKGRGSGEEMREKGEGYVGDGKKKEKKKKEKEGRCTWVEEKKGKEKKKRGTGTEGERGKKLRKEGILGVVKKINILKSEIVKLK
jgi:hypothetical protein